MSDVRQRGYSNFESCTEVFGLDEDTVIEIHNVTKGAGIDPPQKQFVPVILSYS